MISYDGDPVEFVLARNEHRRHMTKGQRAMAAWMTASLNNDYSTRSVAADTGLSQGMTMMAKVVAEHAPNLVTEVVNGAMQLKPAYDEAVKRRERGSGIERLEALPDDLAAMVRDETLTLDGAEAAQD